MHTKTLVVGQEVRVKGTICYGPGKVVEVTPEGVVVQDGYRGLLRFDKDGKCGEGNDRFECLPILDVKTLVVGQNVELSSGISGIIAKVVEVTPTGGILQKDNFNNPPDMIRFDANGTAIDSRDIGCTDYDGIPGTHEGGPWVIEELYTLARATALREQAEQDYREKVLPFVTWWKSATYEERLVVATKYYDHLSPRWKSDCKPLSPEAVAKVSDILSKYYWGELRKEWESTFP